MRKIETEVQHSNALKRQTEFAGKLKRTLARSLFRTKQKPRLAKDRPTLYDLQSRTARTSLNHTSNNISQTQSYSEDAHLAITLSTGILNAGNKSASRPKTAKHVREDMRKIQKFYCQTLNNSEVAFTPTGCGSGMGFNQLHATMPMNEQQKEMVNRHSKHLFATATPSTLRFGHGSSKKVEPDSPNSPGNVMVSMGNGIFRLARFDSKNPDDNCPSQSGEYVPVMSYVQSRSRNWTSDGV